MAENKGTKSKPAATAAADTVAHRAFVQAYHAYTRHLGEAWENVQIDGQAAYSRQIQEVQEAARAANQSWVEAHRAYTEGAQKLAGGGEEAAKKLKDLAERYQDAVRKALETRDARWQEAQKAYREAVETANKTFREQSEAAYRDYLGEIQTAWSRIDPGTLEPGSLGAIVNSLAAGACSAAGTLSQR